MATDRTDYDLHERTAVFGEAIIAYAKTIPLSDITRSIVDQLVRAGTSIGANYIEADDSDSKRDFKYKIGVCRREARETGHWLRMSVAAEMKLADAARPLWKEAHELNLIFGKIKRSCG